MKNNMEDSKHDIINCQVYLSQYLKEDEIREMGLSSIVDSSEFRNVNPASKIVKPLECKTLKER